METLNECIGEYKQQMEKGAIQMAYQGLMQYVMNLRTHLNNKYRELSPGNIYQGYLDMTYFPIFPESVKRRKLKIAIVLIHKTVKFEVWLVGYNKQTQAKYWKLFKDVEWKDYRVPESLKGVDSIIEHTLVENPDFTDLDKLTRQIEEGILAFVDDIQAYLSRC